jgi:hypothetical protein
MSETMARHSAGGKSLFSLPDGMRGTAVFNGERDEYRTVLTRHWGETDGAYALWCGMNPSTAEASINDPTIGREVGFTTREGLTDYVKVNVSDYRATDPKGLVGLGLRVRSPGNLQAIRDAAADAELIVMACGKLHKSIAYLGFETVRALVKDGRKLWCLGRNSDGSPKHPLYLPSAAALVRFNP